MTSRKARIGGVSLTAIALSLGAAPAFAGTPVSRADEELIASVVYLAETGQVTLSGDEQALLDEIQVGEFTPAEDSLTGSERQILISIQDRSNDVQADGDLAEPDPTEPDPENPENPSEPDPTNPEDPSDPNPTEPEEPIEPDPTVPEEPTEPPVDPTEPPVEPTEPPVDPTEPPVEPTEPPVEPTEPPTPTEPGDPNPDEPGQGGSNNEGNGGNQGGRGNQETLGEQTNPGSQTNGGRVKGSGSGSIGGSLLNINRAYGTNSIIPRQAINEPAPAPAPAPVSEQLPLTGSSVEYQAALAAGLIVAGAGTMYVSRRKGKHAK